MTCSACGHTIGAWNKDPYKILGEVVCDRCWAARDEDAISQRNREKVAAYKREYYQRKKKAR